MSTRRFAFLGLPMLLVGVACTVSAPGGNAFSSVSQNPVGQTPGLDAGDAAPLPSAEDDASADVAQTPIEQSNMLCLLTMSCDPDAPATASSCNLAPDGGPYDPSAGYSDATLACRVEPSTSVANDGLGVATGCSVAGPGMDGAACTQATECAAGLDCVGEGSCRHYCCAGNSQCKSTEFCDVQPLASAATTKVPVCMPIEPAGGCDLLSSTACPTGQTCAIVREDGTTGCVDVGPATAGEACNSVHCTAGLVCLGSLNSRLCYTLCNTMKPSCSASQTCQGGLPLFQNPDDGVCR